MKRLVDRFFRPARPSPEPRSAGEEDRVLRRFLAWRLRMLAIVILLTGLTACIDTAGWLGEAEEPAFTIDLKLGSRPEPAEQSRFGDAIDLIWLASLYAMPASCLVAAACWARPRASRSVLLAGWATSFLVPVAVALMPWSWWEAGPSPRRVDTIEGIEERVAWGLYYFAVLSPAVLALVPGVMRACLRVKMLLPGSVLPGWLLLAAAPFNGLLALAAFVSLAQVAPKPLLLAGMFLWLAAPLTYLVRAEDFTRPIATADHLHRVRRVRALARVLGIASVACLLAYALTWQAFGYRLVGFDPKTSLIRPWQVARYLLDFSGRALFVNVLGADLLLRATLAAWRHQRDFSAGPASAEFDRQMERLASDGLIRPEDRPKGLSPGSP